MFASRIALMLKKLIIIFSSYRFGVIYMVLSSPLIVKGRCRVYCSCSVLIKCHV